MHTNTNDVRLHNNSFGTMTSTLTSSKNKKQKRLTSFFDASSANKRSREESPLSSRFGTCPVCSISFPWHILESHAASCNGEVQTIPLHTETKDEVIALPTHEPIPGLFLYENFISEEEELKILDHLDTEALPFAPGRFNGKHLGKRWGVHCNLRDRRVDAPENPLPDFIQNLVLSKLQHIPLMKGCVPNEANAIDYHRKQGHWLKSHIDDRKLSKEPIANLSLAGDCYMIFRNEATHRNIAVKEQKVLLKRRCLQILTGKARYDFSHGIANQDLLADRRVSVTMRESPLTPLDLGKGTINPYATKRRLPSGSDDKSE